MRIVYDQLVALGAASVIDVPKGTLYLSNITEKTCRCCGNVESVKGRLIWRRVRGVRVLPSVVFRTTTLQGMEDVIGHHADRLPRGRHRGTLVVHWYREEPWTGRSNVDTHFGLTHLAGRVDEIGNCATPPWPEVQVRTEDIGLEGTA